MALKAISMLMTSKFISSPCPTTELQIQNKLPKHGMSKISFLNFPFSLLFLESSAFQIARTIILIAYQNLNVILNSSLSFV